MDNRKIIYVGEKDFPTCIDVKRYKTDDEVITYRPVISCKNLATTKKFKCSWCGDVWIKPDVDQFKFCPTCGAKVMD